MANLKKYGHTSLNIDDFKGMTFEQLQERFKNLPESIVKMISDDVSPKKVSKPKKKDVTKD